MKLLTFELGPKALVQDPCYDRATCLDLVDTLPGKWVGTVLHADEGQFGVRCAVLIAAHETTGHVVLNPGDSRFERLKQADGKVIEVGVDSGQAGIFCDSIYPQGEETGDFDDKESFYGKVCDLTCETEDGWGVIEKGVVSSSGYGDGSYNAYGIKNEDNLLVAIKIVFVGEDEEEESNEEEED